jgi:hypothetical protein
MKNFKSMCEELTTDIKRTYEEGVTIEEAEKLAAKFLYAQIQVGNQLKATDLDARMRKTGVKAIRAAVYLRCVEEGMKGPEKKKPSDVLLEALVNRDELVTGEQVSLDTAEAERDELENFLHVFKEAHIYFRGIAKGRFE